MDKNEPFYIGIGQTENYKRAYTKRSRNKFWHNIVNKVDWDVDILIENLSLVEANLKEIEFVALYGRRNLGLGPLVNLTDGGDGTVNVKRTPEQCEAIRKRTIGFKHSPETKEKIAKAASNISEETRQKMSLNRKGKKRILSTEVKEKMRKGSINSHKNRKPAKNHIQVIDTNTNIIYSNIDKCAKTLSIKSTTLRHWLYGERTTKMPNLMLI